MSDERIRIFLAVRAGRDTLRRRPVTSLQLTFIFWHDGSRGNSQRSNSAGAHPAELIWLRRSGRTNCLPRECGVLWDLRDGPLTLLALQDACETNPGSLNAHLRDLREIRNRRSRGRRLSAHRKWPGLTETLIGLQTWSERWATALLFALAAATSSSSITIGAPSTPTRARVGQHRGDGLDNLVVPASVAGSGPVGDGVYLGLALKVFGGQHDRIPMLPKTTRHRDVSTSRDSQYAAIDRRASVRSPRTRPSPLDRHCRRCGERAENGEGQCVTARDPSMSARRRYRVVPATSSEDANSTENRRPIRQMPDSLRKPAKLHSDRTFS